MWQALWPGVMGEERSNRMGMALGIRKSFPKRWQQRRLCAGKWELGGWRGREELGCGVDVSECGLVEPHPGSICRIKRAVGDRWSRKHRSRKSPIAQL